MEDDETWRDHFIATRHITNPGERAALYREAQRDRYVAVVRGVFVPSGYWQNQNADSRHLTRMRAIGILRPGTVFSHLSAAIAWGLPIVATRPTVPHSVIPHSGGGRSLNSLHRHTLGIPAEVHRVDGLLVTSPHDTLTHVAGHCRPETAVPVLDAGLARAEWSLDRVALEASASTLPTRAGPVRAEWAVRFADPRSGSPGESLSRVTLWRQRLPAPDLQCRFDDRNGLVGFVDFFWPDWDLVGEFDGHGKYLREELRAGRDPAQVVVDEKRREDRLRASGLRVARWEWADALAGARLRRILLDAGLRAS